jgi:hypothetical protein
MSHTATLICNEITEERIRQRAKEGWTLEHDDEHTDGEMALAAASYAINAACHANPNQTAFEPDEMWPWDLGCWKPKGARRDLIRAAALIVAEIERLDRATAARPSRERRP